MRARLGVCLSLFVLLGAASLLGGCNTTAGAGQDISNTGQAISNAAQKAKPQ